MIRLFIDPLKIKDDLYMVQGEDLHYLKNVLRIKANDKVELRDGSNKKYISAVKDISANKIVLNIIKTEEVRTELPLKIILAQALPKSDKMEFIIQKCIELGVKEIIPLQTKNCVAKIKKEKADSKLDRWNKIAKSAATQSGRSIVPQVSSIRKFDELTDIFKDFDLVLMPWELEQALSLKKALGNNSPKKILVVIGPEGGFTYKEVEAATQAGAKTITLGPRILRTETAGMAILAMFNYVTSTPCSELH